MTAAPAKGSPIASGNSGVPSPGLFPESVPSPTLTWKGAENKWQT